MTKPFSVPFIQHSHFVCVLRDPRICASRRRRAWRRWRWRRFHGGGGGGGFHGGGGGGGFHASGGAGVVPFERRRRVPRGVIFAAGCGLCRLHTLRGGFAARPVATLSRPGGNFAGGNQRFGNSASAPPARRGWSVALLWRPNRRPRTLRADNRKPGPPATAAVSTSLAEIAQRDPLARCEAFRAKAAKSGRTHPRRAMLFPSLNRYRPFTIRLAVHSLRVPGFRPNSTLSATSRLTPGSALLGNRGFSGGMNAANSFQHFRGTNGFGYHSTALAAIDLAGALELRLWIRSFRRLGLRMGRLGLGLALARFRVLGSFLV